VIPEAAERGWQGSGIRRSEPIRRSFPGGGGQASDPVRDLPVRRVGKRSSSRVFDPIQQSFEGARERIARLPDRINEAVAAWSV
jgi:hypothetical protein